MNEFTEQERIAMWYADGDTLTTVSLSGAALRRVDPTSSTFVPEGTLQERRDNAKRALFKIAVHCMDRKLATESHVTRKWAKLPEEIQPPIDEIREILNAATVYRDRCLRDLQEECGDEDAPETEKRKPYVITEESGLWVTAISEDQQFLFAGLDEADDLVFRETVIDEYGEVVYPRSLDRHPESQDMVHIVGLPQIESLKEATLLEPDDLSVMVREHLHKYADLKPHEYELGLWYALYTWFHQKCATAPYLRLRSDTGKGKSRIMRSIGDISFLPIRTGGSSSRSGIMRLREKWCGTLLIDESDFVGGAGDAMTKYLNLGFERGQYFVLSDKTDPTQQEYFDPFGPKLIGMRQSFGDVAVEARCINITPFETERRDIPVELGREYEADMQRVRAHIARFVLEHWSEVDGEALMDVSQMDIEPRLKQMMRPLSIVLQIFPDGEERFQKYMVDRQIEVRQERSSSWEGSMFNTVLALATGETTMDDPKYDRFCDMADRLQAVTPSMIAELLAISTKSITPTLKGIGFDPDRVSIDVYELVHGPDGRTERRPTGRRQVRCYTISSPRVWREMVKRYYFDPENPESEPPRCPDILKGRQWNMLAQESLIEERQRS